MSPTRKSSTTSTARTPPRSSSKVPSATTAMPLPPTAPRLARRSTRFYLDAGIAIDLDLGPQSKDAGGLLATLVKACAPPSAMTICFGFDPLSAMARRERAPLPWKDIAAACRPRRRPRGPRLRGPFRCRRQGDPCRRRLGKRRSLPSRSPSRRLSSRARSARPHRARSRARLIYFRLAADPDQFLTIAKFRAIRKLWARVEEACGLRPARFRYRRDGLAHDDQARPAREHRARHDRGTCRGLGGADAVTVLPFSAALGFPDAFARRIARNTQTILVEESNIHRVADPAAGSGAIEDLTEAACEAAWGCSRRSSGPAARRRRLKPGRSRRRSPRSGRRARGQHRAPEDRAVGTSDFPDLAEEPVAVSGAFRAPARGAGTQCRDSRGSGSPSPSSAARQSDLSQDRTAQRPKVFLACSARLRLHRAGELSPRACSRPAASRPSNEGARRQASRNVQGEIRREARLASAHPTRSMRARPRRRQGAERRAQRASILPAGLVPTRRRSSRPASRERLSSSRLSPLSWQF